MNAVIAKQERAPAVSDPRVPLECFKFISLSIRLYFFPVYDS